MQVAQAIQFHQLSAVAAVLYAVRFAKSGELVSLQAEAEAPVLTKAQCFGPFVPTEAEQAAIDAIAPMFKQPEVKADPMVNRLKKSEIEKPVAFVLRFVQANPNMARKDLIAALVNEYGVATYTARTQVQVGLQRRKAVAERTAALAALAAQAEADRLAAEAEQAEEQAEEQQAEAEGEQSNYE